MADSKEILKFDSYWKIAQIDGTGHHALSPSLRYTLKEEDQKRFSSAIDGKGNSRSLQSFFSNSKKTAVAELKLVETNVTEKDLWITLQIETKFLEMLKENDLETCVYQCLRENDCGDILLCTETGNIIPQVELHEECVLPQAQQKTDRSGMKIMIKEFYWDITMFRKKNKAPIPVPDEQIPVIRDTLREGMQQYAKQSKVALHEVKFEKHLGEARLMISLSFMDEEMQKTILTLESWINNFLKKKGYDNVTIFYDEERQCEDVLT